MATVVENAFRKPAGSKMNRFCIFTRDFLLSAKGAPACHVLCKRKQPKKARINPAPV